MHATRSMAEPSGNTPGPAARRTPATASDEAPANLRTVRVREGRARAELSLSNLPFVLARWFVLGVRFSIASVRMVYAVLEARLTRGRRDRRARVLRVFLERSGGAFIKLGQLLAMRIDFFPAAFVEELSALLDRVPGFPLATARAIIEADLGAPIDRLFSEFPETPIAAASFAQVYRAVLVTGEEVAVKVQRPNLGRLIAADVVALRWLGFWIDTLHLLGSIQIGPQITSLKEILEEELDYGFEAESIRTALAACRNYRVMKVPACSPWSSCTAPGRPRSSPRCARAIAQSSTSSARAASTSSGSRPACSRSACGSCSRSRPSMPIPTPRTSSCSPAT
jgi:hypothetical protein